jgi:hypothetical protein
VKWRPIYAEKQELAQNTEGNCFPGGRAEWSAGRGEQNRNLLWLCAHFEIGSEALLVKAIAGV